MLYLCIQVHTGLSGTPGQLFAFPHLHVKWDLLPELELALGSRPTAIQIVKGIVSPMTHAQTQFANILSLWEDTHRQMWSRRF